MSVGENAAAAGQVEVIVTPYRDGPYLIRGSFLLLDQDGKEIQSGSRPVALCRCGRSRLRPFCDGTQPAAQFTAPSGPDDEVLEILSAASEDYTDGPVTGGSE